ncbi:MAG: hypothetical protein KKB81_05245 [Candidatus Margulisbacteria bacterium]|nr:hypothetical protein [Candidatus Margulisiibacteriota bacterium]MBU1021335.1 hypothetical protein [Candidatus Margulisiibacteriota bacterium]MBU1729176.1 hypothetical protein [Candidatus Margulisiibacteriota bacterium]MBU1954849.1 hypothetical protein [Candidatus Margulisiibacteriota bacterium]
MKKFALSFLVLLVLIVFCGISFAELPEKKQELAKVKKYIQLLDNKIKFARSKGDKARVLNLQKIKKTNLARAKSLKEEIEYLEDGGAEPIEVKDVIIEEIIAEPYVAPEQPKSFWGQGFSVLGGYGCGGGAIGVGYVVPLSDIFSLTFDGRYYIGNQYTVPMAKISIFRPFGENYVGVGVGMASYSQTVGNVLGLSGNVAQGSHTDISLIIGRQVENFGVQVGYGTATGAIAEIVYKL